jgi:hypothetical protein
MHTAFQQRRIQRTQFLNPTTPFPTPSVSTTPNEISISEAGPITTSSVTGSKAPSHPHSRKKQPKAHDVSPPSRRRGETSSAEATGGLASPLSVLSTFRRDSLSACPLKLDHDGHVLIDLWLTHFPKMTQLNLSPDIEAIYRPTCNLFFLLAMSSPASFQTTVLHFAVLHRANLREVTDDRHVIYHRTKSLHMLQRAIRHSSTTDDDLVAVLSLATAECRLGDQAPATIHLQGVRQLIRGRRRSGQVPNNQKLELLFSWYNINTPISSHTGARTSPQVYEELRDDFNQFITMLNNFRDVATTQFQSSPQTKQVAPRLSSPSRLNSALCKILTPPTADSPFYTHFSYQMCLFLVLMHIHMALYFFRDSAEQAEIYVKHLTLRTIEMDLEHRTNPVFLLVWLIVTDPVLHNSLRYWYANRIAVIFKLLCWETRHRLTAHLLALLELTEDEEGETIISSFDVGELEREVMHFEPPAPSWLDKMAAPLAA